MKSIYIILLCAVLAAGASVLPAEAVSLTDTKGRTIQATIISVMAGNVNIRLENGRQFRIPMTTLDEQSLTTVESWKVQQIGKHREPFKVSIRNFVEGEKERSTASTRIKTYQEGYTVKIENNYPMKVPSLTVEYLILKEEAITAAQSNNDTIQDTLKGTVTMDPLKMREVFTFNTKALEMKESRLRAGWRYGSGGQDNAVDELGGIWLKIKSGDTVIFEYARPSVLPKKVNWN